MISVFSPHELLPVDPVFLQRRSPFVSVCLFPPLKGGGKHGNKETNYGFVCHFVLETTETLSFFSSFGEPKLGVFVSNKPQSSELP